MTYQYVLPTIEQKELMTEFRIKFQALHEEIKLDVKDSGGRKECLQKLEEASFWLNKAITQNDEE